MYFYKLHHLHPIGYKLHPTVSQEQKSLKTSQDPSTQWNKLALESHNLNSLSMTKLFRWPYPKRELPVK